MDAARTTTVALRGSTLHQKWTKRAGDSADGTRCPQSVRPTKGKQRRRSKRGSLARAALVFCLLGVGVFFVSHDAAFDRRRDVPDHVERRRQQQAELVQRIAPRRTEEDYRSNSTRSNFDYNLLPIAHLDTLMDPNARTTARLVVLVLSARENFARRAMIRQTWGQGHAVYFVLGGRDLHATSAPDDPNVHQQRLSEQEQLEQEQVSNRDLLDTIHPDSYRSLPHKLKYAMRWISRNCGVVEWILKVDDDMFVHVKRVYEVVLRLLNPSLPIVVGRVLRHIPVQRHGKWAETEYKDHPIYPPWPQGSCGYAVSRAVVNYVAEQYDRDSAIGVARARLRIYQGEDTSFGIWVEQSDLRVVWVRSPFFVNHGDCLAGIRAANASADSAALSIGHRITPEQMQKCHAAVLARSASLTSKEQMFYLETPAQHTAPNQEEDGDNGYFEDENLGGTKNEAHRSAVDRYQSEQEAEKRREFSQQRRDQRAQKRQRVRVGS